MTLDHKTSLKSLGYIWSNSQKCIAWVKITFFMPKIIRTLSKDHVPWRYFVNFLPQIRAVRYDDIYRMDEIKSLSFHIMFYHLFCGVAKYIVYGNPFSSFEWLRSLCARCTHEPVLIAGSVHMCNDAQSRLADIIYSSQTEQVGCDEWQSRIRMEQSVDAMSLKEVQLVFPFFLVLCLSYNLKWQTVSNLFIFLCCTFHCVNSKMLN